MEIILDLGGWRKRIEVPRYAYNSGYVEVDLHPPLNTIANENMTPSREAGAVQVRFVNSGKTDRYSGLPVFEYN